MTVSTYMPEQITALYARLSQEDALDGDSNSICLLYTSHGDYMKDYK